MLAKEAWSRGGQLSGTPESRRDRQSLPPERAEILQRLLTALRRDTLAQCVLLVDAEGRVVAEAGGTREVLVDGVLPVLAEEISVVVRLGERWGVSAVLGLHHYEGERVEIYVASAADVPFLLVVVTERRPPARSGVIWLFVRRVVQELRWALPGEGDPLAGSAVRPAGGLTAAQAQALGLMTDGAPGEGARDLEAKRPSPRRATSNS
jgi:hypothetical protein